MNVETILLNKRQGPLYTITAQQTVQEALEMMAARRISSLPVLCDEKLVGIISERDYIRKAVPRRISPWDMRVEEIMTKEVICVRPSDSLQECMRLMTGNGIRHLPVLRNGELSDMLSITDVMSVLVKSAGKLAV